MAFNQIFKSFLILGKQYRLPYVSILYYEFRRLFGLEGERVKIKAVLYTHVLSSERRE